MYLICMCTFIELNLHGFLCWFLVKLAFLFWRFQCWQVSSLFQQLYSQTNFQLCIVKFKGHTFLFLVLLYSFFFKCGPKYVCWESNVCRIIIKIQVAHLCKYVFIMICQSCYHNGVFNYCMCIVIFCVIQIWILTWW